MSYQNLLLMIRQVLVDSSVCTKAQAQGFSLHSARYTIPLVAIFEVYQEAITKAALPDLYAQEADPSIVYDIMEEQVQSIRPYDIACYSYNNLPKEETWDYFKETGRNRIRQDSTLCDCCNNVLDCAIV